MKRKRYTSRLENDRFGDEWRVMIDGGPNYIAVCFTKRGAQQIAAALNSRLHPSERKCRWSPINSAHFLAKTSCGHNVNGHEGDFCPHCGGRIVEVEP